MEGVRKVCKGSTEVRECAWKGAQGCAKVRKGARMCTKGAQRECKGAQGCARVRECAQKGAQWCTKVCEGVRMCTKRSAIVRKRCARWVQAQCRESQRSRKISKKCACFDRAYHEDLTWRGLMGVAQGQEVCGGSAS